MTISNLSMLTDLYEFSMANGYVKSDPEQKAAFDIFFRSVPDHGSFVISAGLQLVIEELQNLHFDKNDLEYLRSLKMYSEDFIDYLKDIRFACDIWAVKEGTPVFPQEPVLTVFGPLVQAQLLETFLLNTLNHQSLIATKARRITYAAGKRPVMEFGARRAQGASAAVWGSRAAVIGGCSSTSNVFAAKKFSIPAAGTMAHAWIEAFPSESAAFEKWAELYPDNAYLLVDTYDVLNSGLPNAIKVFDKLKKQGRHNFGIRIDSGDLTALSKKARRILDQAGFPEAKITVSNALDEDIIKSLLSEKAPIDNFGVGDKLITSASSPVLGGVYKLSLIENEHDSFPKMKISDSQAKLTLPGLKTFYRLYRKDDGSAFADLIALAGQKVSERIEVIDADPLATKRRILLENFNIKQVPQKIFEQGKKVYQNGSVDDIKAYSKQQLAQLPPETQRLKNPTFYPVYLTLELSSMQEELLSQAKG